MDYIPQIPRIRRDYEPYNVWDGNKQVRIDINSKIDRANIQIQNRNYNSAIEWLEHLMRVINVRKRAISGYKGKGKFPGTMYAPTSLIQEYNDVLKSINLIYQRVLEQIQLQQQIAEREARQQAELERQHAIRAMRQQLEREALERAERERLFQEELMQRELERRHLQSTIQQYAEIARREAAIRNAEIIQNTRIKIRVFVGSETINNSAYYITDNEDDPLFEHLNERHSLYREVNNQVLAPIFNISFAPHTLTYINGNEHGNGVSITDIDQITEIKDHLREVMTIDDEFYTDDVWFMFQFPNNLSQHPIYAQYFNNAQRTLTLHEQHARRVRQQIAAYNQQEVDNYQVHGNVVFPHKFFGNIPKIYHENCLINELIGLYSDLPGNKIGKQTIINQFLNTWKCKRTNKRFDPFGTTIGGIKKFCKYWEISYTLLDVLDDIIDTKTFSNGSRRPTLNLLIHENHVSKYTKDFQDRTLDLSIGNDEHTLSEFRDNRKPFKNKIKKELTTIGLGGQGNTNNQGLPNFSFLWQRYFKYKSLFYEQSNLKGRREVYDMNKAFYTCVMNMNPEQSIPKYQVTDDIKAFDQDDELNPLHEYWLADISEKVKANQGLNAFGGQTVNYMMGYRVIYEIGMGRLEKSDITHVRIATDYGKARRLQELLKSVDPSDFKFINGLFGQSYSGLKTVTLNVSVEDLKLLMFKSPELTYEENANGSFKITKTFNQGKYRYLNNSDYHNFVIELCNYHITKKVDEMMATNILRFPDLRVTKIWVDCVGFNYTTGNGLFTGPLHSDNITFKTEMSNFCGNIVKFKYQDPELLIEESHKEIQSFIDTSIVIDGMSGCGKTYHATHNIPHDYRITFKNTNAVRIKGNTIHSAFLLMNMKEFYKHASRNFKDKTILVDELSEIQSYMWSIFFTCHKLYNTKFILVGDLNQIPPYGEDPDYEDYFWLNLRGKAVPPPPLPEGIKPRCDPDLVELCIATLNHQPIPEKLFRTEFFPLLDNHFAFTINCKNTGNKMVMKHRNMTFDPPTIGITVTATRKNKAAGYLTGQMYVVTDFAYTVTLRCIDDPKEPHEITIDGHKYLKDFTPAFFRTIHSSQGATIDDIICIYEIDKIRSKPNGNRILYTALSRVRHISQLILYHTHPAEFDVPRTIIKDDTPYSYLPLNPGDVTPVQPMKNYTMQDLIKGLRDAANSATVCEQPK